MQARLPKASLLKRCIWISTKQSVTEERKVKNEVQTYACEQYL